MHFICGTLKPGKKCIFWHMKKNRPEGCTFINSKCNPVVEQCNTCEHIEVFNDTKYCDAYRDPFNMWIAGNCPLATHIIREIKEEKKTLDPRKAAKQRKKQM